MADAAYSVAVGRELVRALEAAVSDFDTYFAIVRSVALIACAVAAMPDATC